eukprot:1934152-Heterocapsa_arctica.AAC.1
MSAARMPWQSERLLLRRARVRRRIRGQRLGVHQVGLEGHSNRFESARDSALLESARIRSNNTKTCSRGTMTNIAIA